MRLLSFPRKLSTALVFLVNRTGSDSNVGYA